MRQAGRLKKFTAKQQGLAGGAHLVRHSQSGGTPEYQRMVSNLSWASHFLSGAVVVPIAVLLAFSIASTCSGRPAAAEIFEGITYGCKQLEPSKEASGVVHWVRINLT